MLKQLIPTFLQPMISGPFISQCLHISQTLVPPMSHWLMKKHLSVLSFKTWNEGNVNFVFSPISDILILENSNDQTDGYWKVNANTDQLNYGLDST